MAVDRNLTLAWAAGFWEGEGAVTIAKSRNYSLHVNVTNTRLKPLQLFQSIWGGSIREHGKPTDRWARSYRWTVTNRRAASFLRGIRPYVVYRGEQLNTGLALMKNMSRRGRLQGKGQPQGTPRIEAEEIVYREGLYLRMRELNRRGPKTGDIPPLVKMRSAQMRMAVIE